LSRLCLGDYRRHLPHLPLPAPGGGAGDQRGRGIGQQLIKCCEDVVFAQAPKVFLVVVVADFSLSTKRLYEKLGYVEVGKIPDLFKSGVTEYLLMKNK
jgi:ribosomal protein S18 acetylase RimI-like enzyme